MAKSKSKVASTTTKATLAPPKSRDKTKPKPTLVQDDTSQDEGENEDDWVSEDSEEEDVGGPSEDVDDSEREEDSEEEEDIGEEGMQSLMRALEKHPLDDFERAQLGMLAGENSGESSSEEDGEDDEEMEQLDADEDSEEEDDEEEEEGDLELDRLSPSHVLDPDAVPKQKIQINNETALRRIRETIALDSSLPWTETLTITYDKLIDVDPEDDLKRELAFYAQALHSSQEARKLAASAKFPFTRPNDFFAEMVKSDAHMERIRVRLLSESSSLKKSDEKRKERESKKFGKQVQIEKLKEREKSKKEMEERVKDVKRKRKDILDAADGDDAAFDVAVEDALTERPSKKSKTGPSRDGPSSRGGRGGGRHSSGKISRDTRDSKFGFGGKGRRDKSNTRESTDAFVDGRGSRGSGRGGRGGGGRGGGARGGRGGGRGGREGAGGGQKRLGKSRRMAQGGR